MSTIVAVKKNHEVAIAGDTLASTSGRKMPGLYRNRSEKILKFEQTYLGFVGYCVHTDVFASIIEKNPGDLNFNGYRHIFETFLKLHPILKEKFFLNASEEDTFESSDLHVLLVNPSGIFEVTPNRGIMEYEYFWAIGSGSEYALGALHQAYDTLRNAREIAVAGVLAATEFDPYSGLPFTVHTAALQKKEDRSEAALI